MERFLDVVVCRFCGTVASGAALIILFMLLMSLSNHGISSSVARVLFN